MRPGCGIVWRLREAIKVKGGGGARCARGDGGRGTGDGGAGTVKTWVTVLVQDMGNTRSWAGGEGAGVSQVGKGFRGWDGEVGLGWG